MCLESCNAALLAVIGIGIDRSSIATNGADNRSKWILGLLQLVPPLGEQLLHRFGEGTLLDRQLIGHQLMIETRHINGRLKVLAEPQKACSDFDDGWNDFAASSSTDRQSYIALVIGQQQRRLRRHGTLVQPDCVRRRGGQLEEVLRHRKVVHAVVENDPSTSANQIGAIAAWKV